MKKNFKRIVVIALIVMMFAALAVSALAANEEVAGAAAPVAAAADSKGTIALATALVVGIVAAAGAASMGFAISKTADAIARQPEAAGNLRTSLMLGLVFIETAIIYALIVAIFLVFVL